MAFYVDWSEKLQATRAWLDDINAQISDPQNYTRKTGMLNYLFSGLNPQAINAIMREGSGDSKYMPLDIRYIPHEGTTNLITSDASGNCNRVAQRRDLLDTVQPTLYVEHKFTIDEDYVRQNAENGFKLQQRLDKRIPNIQNDIIKNIAEELAL